MPGLNTYPGRFDGFHTVPASVSKTCLVRFDANKYSVPSNAVGRPVAVRAYADRIIIRQDGKVVGEHARCFGCGETIYDPWHYVPVLAANRAPFKDWLLPTHLERVRVPSCMDQMTVKGLTCRSATPTATGFVDSLLTRCG